MSTNEDCNSPCWTTNGHSFQPLVRKNTRKFLPFSFTDIFHVEPAFDPLGMSFNYTNQDNPNFSVSEDLDWTNDMGLTNFSGSHDTVSGNGAPAGQGFPSDFASSTDFPGGDPSFGQNQASILTGDLPVVSSPRDYSMVERTAEANQTPLPSQTAMSSTQPEEPPLSSTGEMVCNYIGCSDRNPTFTTRRDWV